MRLFDGEPMGQPCFDSVEQQFEQAGTQSGQNPYDDGQQRHDLRTGEPFGKLQETDVDTFAPIRDRQANRIVADAEKAEREILEIVESKIK